MKNIVYNAKTGETTIVKAPDEYLPSPAPPPPTTEERVAALEAQIAKQAEREKICRPE